MDLSQDMDLSWDYCDLSMDVDLDVVSCICDNNVSLFDELVVFKTQRLLLMLNGDDLYLFFSEWPIRPSWKTKDFINRCCINSVLPLLEFKQVFDPSLV